ncbi:MAG: guanine deaminase [Pseudomonadota bacterium]
MTGRGQHEKGPVVAGKAKLVCGQILIAEGNPLLDGPGVMRHESDGAIRIENGRITAVGRAAEIDAADTERVDHGRHLILPGFVDCHMHYAQTGMIASWGKRLIDWLNSYTFPEEARFSDPAYAREVAARTIDLKLAHGTTSFATYCTSERVSVDAIFEAAQAKGMAIAAGYTAMDRNVPEALMDTPEAAYEASEALIGAWHGNGRARYAITPRFAPTSTRPQLEKLGALWAAHPNCLMQTHLSEQVDEIAWVRDLFPDSRNYLDVYDAAGLLGKGGIFGHAIHLEDGEIDRLAETGASIAHCPTSNTFIGSGLFDLVGLTARGIPVGLATDTGGGSSFSMLRTMAAAYEIAQLRGQALHPSALLWLATEGSARVMHMAEEVGTLAPGSMADLVVLNLASTDDIAQATASAHDIWEAVFPTIMMGDDRAIAQVYVAGEAV